MTPIVAQVLGEANMEQWTKGLDLTPNERRQMDYVNSAGRSQYGKKFMEPGTQSNIRSLMKADPLVREKFGLPIPTGAGGERPSSLTAKSAGAGAPAAPAAATPAPTAPERQGIGFNEYMAYLRRQFAKRYPGQEFPEEMVMDILTSGHPRVGESQERLAGVIGLI